jgi:RNA-directed DNA polymerase
VPEIASKGALAGFVGLGDRELDWLADAKCLERTVCDEPMRNYRYSVLPRSGSPVRMIECPKSRLKAVQRQVLHDILDWIPAHSAAHGFTRGRSALTHATEHTGRYVVIRLDLEDFFASITAGRVFGIFRAAGYPESGSYTLTALTTNVVPASVWHGLQRPTDPADDLTLSASERIMRTANPLRAQIAKIAREEGFVVNERKSSLRTSAGGQQVCGIVVNHHTNFRRSDYDALKAILHNAARRGPDSQNREAVPDFRAHLMGRVGWVEQLNPVRGEKLRRELARISWTDPG